MWISIHPVTGADADPNAFSTGLSEWYVWASGDAGGDADPNWTPARMPIQQLLMNMLSIEKTIQGSRDVDEVADPNRNKLPIKFVS